MTARRSTTAPPSAGDARHSPPPRTAAGVVVLATVLGLLVAAASIGWVGDGAADDAGGAAHDRAGAVRLVAAVCGTASLGGWIIARLGAEDPALAVSRSLAAILLRLLLPLGLLGWLSAPRESWPAAARMRDAGAAGLLVVFYLSLLATDILLHIMWGPKGPRRQPQTQAPAPDHQDAG